MDLTIEDEKKAQERQQELLAEIEYLKSTNEMMREIIEQKRKRKELKKNLKKMKKKISRLDTKLRMVEQGNMRRRGKKWNGDER
jgi:predicted RNase H-like nuclease (RuvC/YqgF family)